jgi:hypothetical protein
LHDQGLPLRGAYNEQKNQTQAHELQAECDPGDRYAEQNTHHRGPPRPSTDLKIYAHDYYTERAFLAQAATFRERGNSSVLRIPLSRVELSKRSGIEPTAAEIVDDRDRSAGINPHLNGRHFDKEAAAADQRQNNETKPIRGPEAG